MHKNHHTPVTQDLFDTLAEMFRPEHSLLSKSLSNPSKKAKKKHSKYLTNLLCVPYTGEDTEEYQNEVAIEHNRNAMNDYYLNK